MQNPSLTEKQKKFITDDLALYELRQLLGAGQVLKHMDENAYGNICSLMRDCIYLHARNLYNFFHGCAEHDASVYEFTKHDFDVSLYIKWKPALHNHVLHARDSRRNPNNAGRGQQLSDVALDFVDDIEKLWSDWILVAEKEEKTDLHDLLTNGLKEAKEQADDDLSGLNSKESKK